MTSAAQHLKEVEKECGSLDRKLRAKLGKRIKRYSKGHLNGPTAPHCWKCGEDLTVPIQWSSEEGWKPLPYESPGDTGGQR